MTKHTPHPHMDDKAKARERLDRDIERMTMRLGERLKNEHPAMNRQERRAFDRLAARHERLELPRDDAMTMLIVVVPVLIGVTIAHALSYCNGKDWR